MSILVRHLQSLYILISDLGAVVLEDEFAPEFRQLTKQIIDGTLFQVTALECYSRFADIWLRYSESEEECGDIIKAMMETIPNEMYEFGQSEVFMNGLPPPLPPMAYSNTLAELFRDYKWAEVVKTSFSIPPKHYVPKKYLTPVNSKRVIRKDDGAALKPVRKRV